MNEISKLKASFFRGIELHRLVSILTSENILHFIIINNYITIPKNILYITDTL